MFSHQDILNMGAVFYANGQVGTVRCVACGGGEVDFIPQGNPVFGRVQVHRLICDHCGRSGLHPN